MSNPNNLIRPGVLETPSVANTQRPPQTSQSLSLPDLENLIGNIVKRVVQENNDRNNPDSILLTATDEIIRPEHQGQVGDLDKIPDIIRSLRDFSGNPAEFSSWRKSVDRVLKIYESTKGSPRYYGIINTIRNKITGNADMVLESYNVPLDWKAISHCLNLHYADRRDITTLECQLASLIQGRNSIPQFYQEVYNHLSLILSKLSSLEMGQEALHLLTQTYRNKALDTFIRGLNGDLPKLLGMKEPSDLPQALHLCMKLENQGYRAQYAYNQNKNRKFQQPQVQQVPQMNRKPPFYPQAGFFPNGTQHQPIQNSFSRPPINQNNFFKPNPVFPQNSNQFLQYQNFQPPRPFAPKPLPKPTPMEIDSSQQTRNYINRPNFNAFAGKRPPPPSNQFKQNVPNKYQRVNYISQETERRDDHEIQDNNGQFWQEHGNEQSWQEYSQEYERQEEHYHENDPNQFVDVNFLD